MTNYENYEIKVRRKMASRGWEKFTGIFYVKKVKDGDAKSAAIEHFNTYFQRNPRYDDLTFGLFFRPTYGEGKYVRGLR